MQAQSLLNAQDRTLLSSIKPKEYQTPKIQSVKPSVATLASMLFNADVKLGAQARFEPNDLLGFKLTASVGRRGANLDRDVEYIIFVLGQLGYLPLNDHQKPISTAALAHAIEQLEADYLDAQIKTYPREEPQLRAAFKLTGQITPGSQLFGFLRHRIQAALDLRPPVAPHSSDVPAQTPKQPSELPPIPPNKPAPSTPATEPTTQPNTQIKNSWTDKLKQGLSFLLSHLVLPPHLALLQTLAGLIQSGLDSKSSEPPQSPTKTPEYPQTQAPKESTPKKTTAEKRSQKIDPKSKDLPIATPKKEPPTVSFWDTLMNGTLKYLPIVAKIFAALFTFLIEIAKLFSVKKKAAKQ